MGVIKDEASTVNENTSSDETRMPAEEGVDRETDVSSVEKKTPVVLNQLSKEDMDRKPRTRGDDSADKKLTMETKVNISVNEAKQTVAKEKKVDESNLAIQLMRCKIKDESDENSRHLKSSKKLDAASLEDDLSKLSIKDAGDKKPELRLVAKGPDGGKPVYHIQDSASRHEYIAIAHKSMPCMSYGTTYTKYADHGNNFNVPVATGKRGRDTDRTPAYKYTRPGMPFQNSPDPNLMPLPNDMSSFPSSLYHNVLPERQLQQQFPQQQLPQQRLPQQLPYDNMNNLGVTMAQQHASLVSMPTMSVNNMCGGMVTMKSATDFETVHQTFVPGPIPDMTSNVQYQQHPQPVGNIPDLDYQTANPEELDEILEILGDGTGTTNKITNTPVTPAQLLPESVHMQNKQQASVANTTPAMARFTGDVVDNSTSTTLTKGLLSSPHRHQSGDDSGFETASEGSYRSDFSPESQLSPESNLGSPPSCTLMSPMMSPASVGSVVSMGSPQMPELICQRSLQASTVPAKIQQRVGSEPAVSSNQFGNHGSPTSFASAGSPVAPHSCPPPYPSHRSPYSGMSGVVSPMSVQSADRRSSNSSGVSMEGSAYSNSPSARSLDNSPAGQLVIDAVPSPQQHYPYQQLPQQQSEQRAAQQAPRVSVQPTNIHDRENQQLSDTGIVFDETSAKLMDNFFEHHRAEFLDVMNVLADDLRDPQTGLAKPDGSLTSNNSDPDFNVQQDEPPTLASNLSNIPVVTSGQPVIMAQARSPQSPGSVTPVSVAVVHSQPVILGRQNPGAPMMMSQPGSQPIMMHPIPAGNMVQPVTVPVQSGNNQTLFFAMPVFHPPQSPRKGVVAQKPLRKILPKMFDIKDSIPERAPPKGRPGPKPGSKHGKSLANSLPTTVKDHASPIIVSNSGMMSLTNHNAAPGLPLMSGLKLSPTAAPGGPPMGQLISTCESMSQTDVNKLNLARRCVANMTTDDLEFQDEDGDTYIHVAVCRTDPYLVQAILERIQRCSLHHLIDLQNVKRQTPLYLAVAVNQPAMVRMFVQCGADANSLAQVTRNDCQGVEVKAAIHCASSGGVEYLNTLTELLRSTDINLNLANSEGLTALHCAIRSHGHLKKDSCRINAIPIVDLLIKAGSDSNVQDKKSGKTPLMYAIESRDSQLVTLMFTLISKPQLRQMLKTQTFDGSSCAKIASGLRGDTNPEGWRKITSLILSVGSSENISSPPPYSRKQNVIVVA